LFEINLLIKLYISQDQLAKDFIYQHQLVLSHCDLCFCREMSQLADVNIQSRVGMFTLIHISRCSIGMFCTQSH